MIITPLIERAISFAIDKHANQRRKISGYAYATHPIAVASSVFASIGNWDFLTADQSNYEILPTAALLHDVVEDCGVTVEVIDILFGNQVGKLVDCLTQRDDELYADFIDRVCKTPEAAFIKLHDILHNLKDLDQSDSRYIRYRKAKEQILNALIKYEYS